MTRNVPERVVSIHFNLPDDQRDEYPACAAVMQLRWHAMPDVTSMEDMLTLAYAMGEGYRVSQALGFGDCGTLANTRAAQHERTGRYEGLASELWCCLFFEARRWRWTDWPGRREDEGKPQLDALYGALVEGLRGGDGSVERMANGTTLWRGR